MQNKEQEIKPDFYRKYKKFKISRCLELAEFSYNQFVKNIDWVVSDFGYLLWQGKFKNR